jgi:hypothetical protein
VKHFPVWNKATGECVLIDNAERRMKTLRVRTWFAIQALRRAQSMDGGQLVMYTLTYKPGIEWSSAHMLKFLDWLEVEQRNPLNVWVAELQKRGAVHYHVLALLPPGEKAKSPSQNKRTPNGRGWGWPQGRTHITRGIKYPWYLLKYIQKGNGDSEHEYPYKCKTFGCSRGRLWDYLESAEKDRRLLLSLPGWAAASAAESGLPNISRNVVGGVRIAGWFVSSPFAKTVDNRNGGFCNLA